MLETIYHNSYGTSLLMRNPTNENCTIQLVIDSVGLFMSDKDLEHLLEAIHGSGRPCDCLECGGKPCNKIWCSGPKMDICLKLENKNIEQLEDLIVGTQFVLNMDETLKKLQVKPNNYN